MHYQLDIFIISDYNGLAMKHTLQNGDYTIEKAIFGKQRFGASYVVLNVIAPNGDCVTEVAILDRDSSNIWEPTNQNIYSSLTMSIIKHRYPNKDAWEIYNAVVQNAIQDGNCVISTKKFTFEA